MVAWLWQREAIEDLPLLRAFLSVRREAFVPAGLDVDPYQRDAIPLEDGTSITCPLYVARMVSLLEVGRGDPVLEVGTGMGYQAAILAKLGCDVTTVERLEHLHEGAKENLRRAGIPGVDLRLGDGALGVAERAPFAGIVLGCCVEEIPEALVEQLRPGGRIVAPVGRTEVIQTLQVFRKTPEGMVSEAVRGAFFVPLIRDPAQP